MDSSTLEITKASGKKATFSEEKVAASLARSGADKAAIEEIIFKLKKELYPGITTREIYNRAFELLKNKDRLTASRYKLKNAIYELGPTGFPFEKFIGAIFKLRGFEVEIGDIFQGECVTHEVDVIAKKDKEIHIMECKFHNKPGKTCDVKTPLYIHSRFRDIESFNKSRARNPFHFTDSWVVTNTRFSQDATQYAKCVGLNLLSWDSPKGNSIKEQIDSLGLYPITVSSLLTPREIQFLLSRDVVLCHELLNDDFYLDHLGIEESRKKLILDEMNALCKQKKIK